jgi:hypothetical protein
MAQRFITIKGRKIPINTTFTTAGGRYEMLSEPEKIDVLTHVGIPKKDFEPFTHADVVRTSKLPYTVLNQKIQDRIRDTIGGR